MFEQNIVDFLKKYSMDHSDIDIDAYCKIFLEEMANGLDGNPSSLLMIPTYIEISSTLPLNKPVIVLDAGGTNFRTAVVCFNDEKKPVIAGQKNYPMPGIQQEVSKEDFFKTIAGYMEEIADASDEIGFCFSYPSEIRPDKDGKIIHFSKEIKVRNVEGELIGQNLLAVLRKGGHSRIKKIVILNDTVTTLLAGTSLLQEGNYESYIGFILGTGTNCCYMEKNSNIIKTPGLEKSDSQIINVESGGFSQGPCGELDRLFDQATKTPGRYTFEKMYSGAYFGPLCRLIIGTACRDNLFSPATQQALQDISSLDTRNVSEFVRSPYGENILSKAVTTEPDRVSLYHLLDRMIERSAKLCVIALASVILKSGKGENPCRPVCITAEGSTFYGLKGLRFRVEYYLKKYLTGVHGRYFEIVSIENATLIGAAIAGLGGVQKV
jgi:hexokinase